MTETKKPRGRPPIDEPDYNAARARKMTADAELAELELRKAKRELVASDDVKAAWIDVLSAMKAKLTALPTICAPMCAVETEIAVIQNILEGQVNEALDELSAYKPDDHAGRTVVSDHASDGDAEAAAAPKRRRVGRPRKASKLGE
tara:strand:- start:156 stop:593 length:438 start_codon:yes stop_codon:yes gene_type:complete